MNAKTVTSLQNVFDVFTSETSEIPNTVERDTLAAIVPTVTAELISAEPTSVEPLSPEEIDAKEDFEFSRGAMKSIAVEAQTALHRAVDVASQTDTPRAFEAVAALLKSTIEAHQVIQGLHKSAAENKLAIKTTKNLNGSKAEVNVEKGIVFAGTADQLLRMIDETRK